MSSVHGTCISFHSEDLDRGATTAHPWRGYTHNLDDASHTVVFPMRCVFFIGLLLLRSLVGEMASPQTPQKTELECYHQQTVLFILKVQIFVRATHNSRLPPAATISIKARRLRWRALLSLRSLAMDLTRVVRASVRLFRSKPISPVYYHLIGWGLPIAASSLSWLVDIYAKDINIIRPGFGEGDDNQCWLKGRMENYFYLALPVGMMLSIDVLLMATTVKKIKNHTQNTFTLNSQNSVLESSVSNISSIIAMHQINDMGPSGDQIHRRSDHVAEFWLQVKILFLTVLIWVSWIMVSLLAWCIHRIEIRVIPGFLIASQGIGFFFIFAFHKNKQRVLRKKFPNLFMKFGKITHVLSLPNLYFRSKSDTVNNTTEIQAAEEATVHSNSASYNNNRSLSIHIC
ncbi:unnamed protein product, partial [Meganyctiphanes norvegica]